MASVMVKLTDGKEKDLAKLTEKDLPNIALITNAKGQPSLPLKACIVEEDDGNGYATERRLFKWGPMPKVVMYNHKIPSTMEKGIEQFGREGALAYMLGNWAVDDDKAHNGIVGTNKAETFRKEFLGTLKAISIEQLESDAMKPLLDVIATKCKMSVAEIIEEVKKG